MHTVDPKILRFGNFVLDRACCSLSRGNEEVRLRPKTFDVLRYLVENQGRLVSKDELMEAVWPGVFVTDDSLVQCIKEIREALGDGEHRLVKTVRRRGYLFAAEVSLETPASARPPAQEQQAQVTNYYWRPSLPRLALLGAAAMLVMVIVVIATRYWTIERSPAPTAGVGGGAEMNGASQTYRPSLAVLPLVSLSDSAAADYFVDGLTEDIISALGRFAELSVRSRNAVFVYKGKAPPPDEVGRALNVRYVVEGSVRRSADRIRVSVQLTDTSRGVVLWSEQYDGEPKDIFALQDDITRRIAGTVAARLGHLELARVTTKPPSSLEAYDLVLRGRDLLARATRTANSQARSLFENALALDPQYVPALVGLGLADVNAVRYGWTAHPDEALQRAERLGQSAITLDGSAPSGHALLARVYIRRGDLDRALDAMNRALASNPSDADNHAGLGNVLLLLGNLDGAIKAMETAAQLQPDLSVTDQLRLGMAYVVAGRPADAIRILERALARNDDNPFLNAMLAAAYAEAGRQEDAGRQSEIVRRLSPFFASAELGSLFRNPDHREKMLLALRKAGL